MIEDSNFPAHSFDVITLWSVIEHVNDPKAVMSIVNELIKPGGVVVVKTPNQDSLITLLARWSYILSAGRYLLPVYSDDHLYRFSEPTLRKLLQVTNFNVMNIVQDDNLEVMKTRMQLYPHYNFYKLAMGIVHAIAKPIHKENQLLAYARPI
jgi:2-polyprenyl-3-methyl-5-hydroxy-6-metoxy-1,4-benzoquinol methylase